MPDVSDPIPRSAMKPDQQRRIGALQAATSLIGRPSRSEHIDWLMRVSKWIEGGYDRG